MKTTKIIITTILIALGSFATSLAYTPSFLPAFTKDELKQKLVHCEGHMGHTKDHTQLSADFIFSLDQDLFKRETELREKISSSNTGDSVKFAERLRKIVDIRHDVHTAVKEYSQAECLNGESQKIAETALLSTIKKGTDLAIEILEDSNDDYSKIGGALLRIARVFLDKTAL